MTAPNHSSPELAAERDVLRQERARLEQIAVVLADQRLHLAELFERLAVAQARWQQTLTAIVDELTECVESVPGREARLRSAA